MADVRIPQSGDVYESRDRAYEPGRRVMVVTVCGEESRSAWAYVECVANPSRPDRVESRTTLSVLTLHRKWRLIEEDDRG